MSELLIKVPTEVLWQKSLTPIGLGQSCTFFPSSRAVTHQAHSHCCVLPTQ